jgi:hypothetical protein
MRVLVVHDAKGRITSYAIPAREAENALGIEPERGQRVTEIDVPELDRAGDVRERLHLLDEALHDARIERGRLVR